MMCDHSACELRGAATDVGVGQATQTDEAEQCHSRQYALQT